MIDYNYLNHKEFINYLFSIKDEKYKDFSSKIANSNYPLIGIKLPILKEIAKAISKQNTYLYFNNCTFTYFEEIMIYGFLLKYLNSTTEIINYFKIFVEKIDSWSFTDSIIADLKIVKKHKEQFLEFINTLFTNKEFVARSGYIFLLDYFIEDNYLDFVIEKLNLDYDFYYVNMAKAWLLSVMYIKFPNKVIEFLKVCKNNFVVNKTISKIRDSYRVSSLDKQKLTEYKR